MKNKIKKLAPLALVGVISGATTFGAVQYFNDNQNNTDFSYFSTSKKDAQFAGINAAAMGDDFVKASKTTVPAVVTIRNYQNRAGAGGRSMEQDIFEFFFGDGFRNNRSQQREKPKDLPSGLGSGVIISPDGYIISNNHVVAGASKLEVVLSNKKTYTAKLIGADPSTDIALLKIEDKGLPYLNFANSDLVEVGQWVLAVGNPLGLNSTVTAGIVSAKGRSIDILSQQSRTPIESFIQTDAAINRGNSGGALVNTRGDLIGINSAISSSSGYYEGYGFAVPSNLAKKVVEDIKKFGLVQRGFLGIGSLDLSDFLQVKTYNQRNKTNLKSEGGIYVTEVSKNSGAEDAGIKTGDIIKKIDDVNIGSFSDLSLAIGSKRPGDKVQITYFRNGKEYKTTASLKDRKGNTSLRSKADLSVTEKIGGEFEPLSERVKISYGLNSGVIAKNIVDGGELSQIGVVDNYTIMEVNGKPVNSQKDIENILKGYKGTVSVVYLDEYGRITRKGFVMP
ncbi:MAG: trypsin-like peptidase domain-containing protein [Flavobacteriaceae bacterium]|nr:trypsin-like peptidase domain-containing protein [Flavobacteriaceae bacterium]